MHREIQIDLLDVDVWSLMRDKPSPPAGITVMSPVGTKHYTEGATSVPMFIVLSITLPIATNIAASYIFEYLSKHGAKRIRIDREEITFSRGEVERVVREKIDIQQ
jgi:hypothetical protein